MQYMENRARMIPTTLFGQPVQMRVLLSRSYLRMIESTSAWIFSVSSAGTASGVSGIISGFFFLTGNAPQS